ncbi:NAD-glutamate dehydrogenase [Sulfurimonas sp. MAG313]|nr:NAD-glutamate dehydrogenase domain-containing protein [Sulfurimonas sp. MAG313]MDF1880365.1 NAD-glutamate dehydrogenase [Sulfurimonas sp. MAG313]
MPETAFFDSICSQLLRPDDLQISSDLFERIMKEKIVSQIYIHDKSVSIKIYADKILHLSSMTPVLHDFGFEIIDEITYTIPKNEKSEKSVYVNRFNLDIQDIKKFKSAKDNIEKIISLSLLQNNFEKCSLYSLVYLENLSLRHVTLMRAIIEYLDQAVLSLNASGIIQTLNHHHGITKLFVDYFLTKFDPTLKQRDAKIKRICEEIDERIKVVPNILEDKILKLTYTLLQSLLRTNYFLKQEGIALKIHTELFSEHLRGIQPKFEIFVYHPEFSGLHLRMSKISRGGLRWSERHEDYRTEIKSLMITQEGKNSIIVPDGAKGGFVIRRDKTDISKEYFEEIYTKFINNLLDMVDNIIDAKVVKDKNIIAYDEDDTYFVVAADKGTASMSDVANNISISRNYWLKDAFASGGSNGFGHKDLGITAKGAIISTQRFFIEKGVDFYKDSISIVGLGSMNGDVFGNGMIESKAFKLLAAISHKEIFIDPDPIPLTSYEERQRLFMSKNGSWSAYNVSLISEGGGVFLRSEKSIELSKEIKKLLGTTRKTLSGEELAKKILCLKVDMFFNGGVGTYVKSSDESNLDIGDKQNESVRIDGNELNAYCVCEGGNLGFTQRARIEYAHGGGRINLDGIDNSAGVNISDHEVNLKILLNSLEEKGVLTQEERNITLASLTDQVVKMVLWDNYNQSLALSRDERLSCVYAKDFIGALNILERHIPAFKRSDFQIPKDENLSAMMNGKGAIVRPILASILSYAKIFVKNVLLESTLVDENFSLSYLYKYFPKSFVGIYEREITEHPLRRELIATMMADKVINFQGASFISDFERIGEEKFINKIKSYLICNQLFETNDIRHELFRQDFIMPSEEQYELLSEMERTLTFSVKWMIKYLTRNQIDANHILENKDALFVMLDKINGVNKKEIIKGNDTFNSFFAHIEYLRFAVAAISIKESTQHSFDDVATLFYMVVSEFKIIELLSALDTIPINIDSDRVLKRQMLQFIDFIVVHYTHKILSFQRLGENPQDAFASFVSNENEAFSGTKEQLEVFENYETKGLKEITITVNQLMASAI